MALVSLNGNCKVGCIVIVKACSIAVAGVDVLLVLRLHFGRCAVILNLLGPVVVFSFGFVSKILCFLPWSFRRILRRRQGSGKRNAEDGDESSQVHFVAPTI